MLGRAAALGLALVVAGALAPAAVPPAAASDSAAGVGLVDEASGRWYLRDDAGGTTAFYFGDPGDAPFTGDWDCDGVDTPGLYRRSDGYVYLRNTNSQGNADVAFYFGDPGDVPLPGDFDGDGCDTVSLYRPHQARIFIVNRLGAGDAGLGRADYDYLFGDVGDAPFVGDFDGDGLDEVGLHRRSTGFAYFRYSRTGGRADHQLFYGDPGDVVFAADWTGDGADTVGLFRPGEGRFYLRHSNEPGNADAEFDYGSGRLAPVIGRFGSLPGGAEPPPRRPPSSALRLERIASIGGAISPKSVVHSGAGLFFAQNMMYRHTITVYDRSFRLVATISDRVNPAAFGLGGYPDGSYQGAPVEAAFTSSGSHAYVSNYQMFGPGFNRAGHDGCNAGGWDESFLYRVDTATLRIDRVIPVGAVPKYVAVTPDDATVLVTNWCSFDMSVVDTATARERARVPLGRHPRGIAVDPAGRFVYVAVMGSSDVARVDLGDLSVSWLRGVGANPRHLVMSPDGAWLYVSLNGAGRLAKVDPATGRVVATVRTGSAPRSMAIAPDGESLYVVNYHSDTVAKVATADMRVLQTVPVPHHPIGITYDEAAATVWVSSYVGAITVFADR